MEFLSVRTEHLPLFIHNCPDRDWQNTAREFPYITKNLIRAVDAYVQEQERGKASLKILEVGYGDGTTMESFVNAGYTSIQGIDLEDRRPFDRELDVVCARIEDMPFVDNDFDVVISANIFDPDDCYKGGQDPELMLEEIARVLKKEGVYFWNESSVVDLIQAAVPNNQRA